MIDRSKIIKEDSTLKKVIGILSILALVGALGMWIWWLDTPHDMITKNEKLIVKEIVANYRGEMALSEFRERLEKQEVEKVYRQLLEKKYGTIAKHYIKLRGEDFYYLVYVPIDSIINLDLVTTGVHMSIIRTVPKK